MTSRFAYRFLEQRTALASAFLLGLCVLASTAVTGAAEATIQSTLQENWRGAYDLLVFADAGTSDQASATGGLIEQNFTSLSSGGRITLGQLQAVRDISDVDVAAPLARVGQISSPGYAVLLGGGDSQGDDGVGLFTSRPQAFEVRVEVIADDGVRPKTMSTTVTTVALARGASGPLVLSTDGLATNAGASGTGEWFADISVPAVPELASDVIAIDPVAERQLLGEAGSFIAPLAKFEAAERAGERGRMVELVPPRFRYERELLAEEEASTAVPLILSDSAYAPITARVQVLGVDLPDSVTSETIFGSETRAQSSVSTAVRNLLLQAPRRAVMEQDIPLTDRLVPFAIPFLSVKLPGADTPPEGAALESSPAVLPRLTGRAMYRDASTNELRSAPTDDFTAATVAQPQGWVHILGSAQEQSYRPAPALTAAPPTLVPPLAPLGTYHPGDVTGTADSASFVPLGTYAATTSTVASPGPFQGARLAPSFSGRGSVTAAPGALTTLDALEALRPGAGLDVLRVRVTGVDTFNQASVQRLEDVAARITALGLSVRVVAGSSLEPVGVYLPQYFEDGADLGWTQQEWTSLGAAVKVEQAALGTTAWLLTIALIGVAVLATTAQGLLITTRRRDAALLTLLGWRRSRVFAWTLAPSAVGLMVVLATSAASLLLRPDETPVLLIASLAAGLYASLLLATCGVAMGRGWRHHGWRRHRSAHTSQATTVGAVARRIARARPSATLQLFLALVVLPLTAASFTGVLLSGQDAAGASRISILTSQRLLLPQVALAVVSLLAGVALLRAGTKALIVATGGPSRLLTTCGWTGQHVLRLPMATIARAAVPAGVLVLLASMLGARRLALGDGLFVVAIAATALVLAVAFSWVVARRSVHRLVLVHRLPGQAAVP